jgi:hypothetical protein
MANTGTKVYQTVVGDRIMGAYKIEGDGSDTTFDLPLESIDSAWTQRWDDTETSEQLLTWSGNTLTFPVVASGKYIIANYIGV